jgi:hypothetical protein
LALVVTPRAALNLAATVDRRPRAARRAPAQVGRRVRPLPEVREAGPPRACENVGEGAHYVDSAEGDDSLDGATPETAWKTLDKVNAATFAPGDSLSFRASGRWTGQLAPRGSGEAGSPIVIDRYGSGALPLIAAGSGDNRLFE